MMWRLLFRVYSICFSLLERRFTKTLSEEKSAADRNRARRNSDRVYGSTYPRRTRKSSMNSRVPLRPRQALLMMRSWPSVVPHLRSV